MLYKHKQNTGRTFAGKHDIFTFKNNLIIVIFTHEKLHGCYSYIINCTFHRLKGRPRSLRIAGGLIGLSFGNSVGVLALSFRDTLNGVKFWE